MAYELKDARERVACATEKSKAAHSPELHLDIDDAFLNRREVGEGANKHLDAALWQIINLERHETLRLDRQMMELAHSIYYQAVTWDFYNNRLNEDGTLNRTALYRLHARLVQAGRMMERNKMKHKKANPRP